MTDRPLSAPPPLAPGDVYVYSHGNGAIFVLASDGRSRLVPLDEALDVAQGCHEAGCRVTVAWDDTDLARGVVERLRALAIPLTEYDAPGPAHTWDHGTDALIEAAAIGTDHILDDLLVRGADVHHRDESGSTALHHAAANGNGHAVDALVAAGADVDRANDQGFTPHMLAMATKQTATAQRLASLGADTSPGSLGEIRFRRAHLGAYYVWLILAVLAVAGAVIVGVTVGTLPGLVALVLFVGAYLFVMPPRAFWSGGAPRRLDGTTLTIRGQVGGTREIDLEQVTVAALGGAPTRSGYRGARWLLLGHPDGHPVNRRALRRLQVPPDEIDALAARVERIIVVPVDGVRPNDALLPIGNLLSGRGIDLSAGLRAQLHRARDGAPR